MVFLRILLTKDGFLEPPNYFCGINIHAATPFLEIHAQGRPQALYPQEYHYWVCLPVLPSATFYVRSRSFNTDVAGSNICLSFKI